MRARLVTAEKQLVWLRQENAALNDATQEATRLRPKSAAGALGGRNNENQDLIELERQLREKNAKLTLLKSRFDQLQSKSDASKEIQTAAMQVCTAIVVIIIVLCPSP